MDRFRAILRGTGVVTGVVAILLGGLLVLVLAYVFVAMIAFGQLPWNFPGDPPVFDMMRDAVPWLLLMTLDARPAWTALGASVTPSARVRRVSKQRPPRRFASSTRRA